MDSSCAIASGRRQLDTQLLAVVAKPGGDLVHRDAVDGELDRIELDRPVIVCDHRHPQDRVASHAAVRRVHVERQRQVLDIDDTVRAQRARVPGRAKSRIITANNTASIPEFPVADVDGGCTPSLRSERSICVV